MTNPPVGPGKVEWITKAVLIGIGTLLLVVVVALKNHQHH
jgi:hypothetical protein